MTRPPRLGGEQADGGRDRFLLFALSILSGVACADALPNVSLGRRLSARHTGSRVVIGEPWLSHSGRMRSEHQRRACTQSSDPSEDRSKAAPQNVHSPRDLSSSAWA